MKEGERDDLKKKKKVKIGATVKRKRSEGGSERDRQLSSRVKNVVPKETTHR